MLPRIYSAGVLIGLLFCHAHAAVPGPVGRNAYGISNQRTLDPAMDYFHALGFLQNAAADLEKGRAGQQPDLRQPLQQIQTDAAFLRQKWLEWGRRHPGRNPYFGNIESDGYLSVLKESHKQLKEFRKAKTEDIAGPVKAIAADLHAKAENCRYSADGLGKDIDVTVRTKKGTEEVAGYEVFCAPVALVKFKKEHVRFPKISSPTVYRNLAPGHYLMWLRKGNENTEPVAQTIGGRGETEWEIDLPVPSGVEVAK
jgi:hypothetical protein